jgi:hypothetical protein
MIYNPTFYFFVISLKPFEVVEAIRGSEIFLLFAKYTMEFLRNNTVSMEHIRTNTRFNDFEACTVRRALDA